MANKYLNISDVSFLNSNSSNIDSLINLYKEGLFNDIKKWTQYKPSNEIPNLGASINSRLKNRMSQLSLGVFDVIDNGPGADISGDEELCLFTCFGEIETTDKIIKSIVLDKYQLVSPTLFHNSVHHTSLGYYTIIKKIYNSCITISDGLRTNISFIQYINYIAKMNKKIVIVSGDEYSSFFNLDTTVNQSHLFPVFIAYRINYNNKLGFYFVGIFDSLDDLVMTDNYNKASSVIADKETFLELKNINIDKQLLTEYPLVQDNPCSIIYRLALPFCLNLKDLSFVIQKIESKYYLFEVML